jgi:mannose-1-phosphate guanylyltransferase/mannose-1-phosphate guanylyltransferase/mannose-6-phosphate isomerase
MREVEMIHDCIIMAGGSGTRLWPASTILRPKQFLEMPLAAPHGKPGKGPKSFFGAALERALALTGECADGRVIVAAGKNHINPIIGECAKLEERERKRLVLIPEPLARNTAPAIACALVYLNHLTGGRDRNVLVLTSDHVISPPGTFKIDAKTAAAMAQGSKLAVFGIPPERPETGFGYIEAAGALPFPDSQGQRKYRSEVFSVASFREKPDLKTAKKFIKAKKFYWNSGMFAFSSKFMLAEFLAGAPEVINPFMELWAPGEHPCRSKKGLKILEGNGKLEAAYLKTKTISFDYAIAEKCRSTVMVRAGFSWNDVGSWDEYARLAEHTMSLVYGTGRSVETCFVDSDIPVALCGVEDLIVVLRSGKDGGPPALLISKKGETQRVKEIVEMIKASGKTELL